MIPYLKIHLEFIHSPQKLLLISLKKFFFLLSNQTQTHHHGGSRAKKSSHIHAHIKKLSAEKTR